MVYSFVRRESPESLLRVTKTDETTANSIVHFRAKSDSLIDFSKCVASIPVAYEDKNLRHKSPSRQKTREHRANSCDRKGMLVKRKSTKSKENLSTKGNLFAPITDAVSYAMKDKKAYAAEQATKSDNCDCAGAEPQQKQKQRKSLKSRPKKVSKTNALFDAVLDNDFSLLRKLIITDEFDVDEVNVDGSTGLHFAAAAGHVECMQLLLDCGSRIHSVDDYQRTPLEYAVLYGNFDCASLLIEHGADSSLIKDGILL